METALAVTEIDLTPVVMDHALPFAPDVLANLLNDIAETGTIWKSCKANGVAASTYLRARTACKPLANLHDAALKAYTAKLHMTLHERAVEGVEKNVYFQGQVVGTERQYSDRLFELLLKRHDPAFRDKVEHDHQHGGGVLVIHQPAGAVAQSPEEWHKDAVTHKRVIEAEEVTSSEPSGGGEKANDDQ